MNIKIYEPNIFPKDKIRAGITCANFDLFPKGFSIFPGKILNTEEVENFRAILAENIACSHSSLVFQKQMHGDTVRIVSQSGEIEESDGLITSARGLFLNVTLADCVGVLIYDSRNEVIAAVHSGWRGTAMNITEKAILMMKNNFGSKSEDLFAWLSPAAGFECYEVGSEVADLFPSTVKKKFGNKYLLDVRGRVFEQLLEQGIKEENIESSKVCTISDSNFHSFRRDGDNSGRMSAFIGLL